MIEIKKEMSNILINMKLPPQIHYSIKELYLEYQNSYKKLIEYLKIRYPNKEREILRIEIETLKDYEEDLQMVQTIEFEEFEQRRTIIIETINNILKCMKENKDISIEEFDNDMSTVIKEKQNETFTKIVIDTAFSEMVSSSKYLLNKINHLGLEKDENLEMAEQQFLEEIKIIKEKMLQKSLEINQIIREHFKSIYMQLKNVIETYKNEIIKEKIKNTIEESKSEDNER